VLAANQPVFVPELSWRRTAASFRAEVGVRLGYNRKCDNQPVYKRMRARMDARASARTRREAVQDGCV